MSADTIVTEAIPINPPARSAFDDALEGINWDSMEEPAFTPTPAAEPDKPADVVMPDPGKTPESKPADEPAKPDESKKPDEPAKPEDEAAKPGSYKALKMEKDREREEAITALKAEYDARIADLSAKAGDVETVNKTWAEKMAATEALKAAHEAKLAELESGIIADYETPYSLEVDPDAVPVFASLHSARSSLDNAVQQAATSLGEDQRSVVAISQNKQLFGEVLAAMTQGMSPDNVHADALVAGLEKAGVTVAREEARQVIRDLKSVIPKLIQLGDAQRSLIAIKERNEPNWTRDQAARSEAYRRHIASKADVADDAAEGDDAVLAGILKGRPELRESLKQEAERLSALVIGPAPGKGTAATIRATPKLLHETAVKAARLPVMMKAYQSALTDNASLTARIAELEARIAGDSGAVPKPSSPGDGAATTGKVPWDQAMQEYEKSFR